MFCSGVQDAAKFSISSLASSLLGTIIPTTSSSATATSETQTVTTETSTASSSTTTAPATTTATASASSIPTPGVGSGNHTSLTTDQKVGLGLGIAIGVAVILISLLTFFAKRQHQQAPATQSVCMNRTWCVLTGPGGGINPHSRFNFHIITYMYCTTELLGTLQYRPVYRM